jgi:hypothetical protein
MPGDRAISLVDAGRGLNARLGLQIHKFIWEPSMKGV